ncbi:MAG: enterotoxin, partial [Lentisphaeria bacterium]|nr:enterotoxin [Lentisphaeria bacterium]
YTGSMVIGAYPKGLLRRAFLGYLEKERVHPYRPFLNYNSWYDIGYFNKYNEHDALAVIKSFGEELVKKRGVKMDSLLFDDGWDDDETLWAFHAGFPRGFKNVSKLANQYGIKPGVWLSPWGGYGQPRTNRVNAGRKNGYEIYENKEKPDDSVFKMSGPKYYARFSAICKGMISSYGINQFKFDGIGGNSGNGSDGYAADFEAATKLIKELQTLDPEVYINLTTGTWPSPFWLKTCDSIWHGGFDHSFAGVGTKRQQWITYRDGMTYQNIVKKAPLFPITSLMVHGTILAEKAKGLASASNKDFRDEIRTMFGAGVQLQEMYISPKLMNTQKWDDLAASAKWARRNAEILTDSHWIGGDPLKLEAYGFAAWKNNFGTLTLRNPSDKKQKISFTLQEAFELPKEAWSEFDFKCPYPIQFKDGKAVLPQRIYKFKTKSFYEVSVTLEPFEVLVFETTPTQ